MKPIKVRIKAQDLIKRGLLVFGTTAFLVTSGPSLYATDFEMGFNAYLNEDYSGALSALRPLAEAGNADAQTLIGLMYDTGKGVARNDTIAAKWYTRAADEGHAEAKYRLAKLYEWGYGVEQDMVKALALYHQSAKLGHAPAQYDLG